MIDLQTGEQTYVSRLRVSGSSLDPLAAQLRLASLFQAAEVQPAFLAPTAIVCIRRLDDPRPRSISLSQGQSSLSPEWQQSVRASIEQLARHGARPARETVGGDVPCVVFADRAELLAALAADWCEHRAATRWWWRSLFKETPDVAALVKLWRRAPEYVPGALEHLARRHEAVSFARALAPEAARAILEALTHRFALHELQAAASRAPQNLSRTHTTAQTDASSAELLARETTLADFQPVRRELEADDAAWRVHAPEALSGELDLPQQSLLGIGLTLARAPLYARSRAFALRVNARTQARASVGRNANVPPPPPGARVKETSRTGERAHERASKSGAAATRDAFAEERDASKASPVSFVGDAQSVEADASDACVERPELQDVDASVAALSDSTQDAARTVRNETTHVGARSEGARASESFEGGAAEIEIDAEGERGAALFDERGREASHVAATETTHVAPLLLEAQIETGFGGLFHLVNLGLFLELYGDFTTPAEPGIALAVWDFVALLGRRLCGARVERDAVWTLLAQLAGREAWQPPGADFCAPDAWRMNSAWLGTFPAAGVWRYAVARGARRESRLQLIHPEKFLVLDVPLVREEEAEAQLARELEVYAGAFVATPRRAPRPFKLRGRTPLARWVERVHLYARARLCRALGTRDARRAARLLCERHARVFVTATHVDIVMRLAELPFEVRVSGLDRDPGWIPAAGRIVAFHFE